MILLFLFLCFTVLPVVELALLIRIGQAIDWPGTIAIVLLTGAIGAALARRAGLAVLGKIQERMAAGELPGRELFDGALILLAGALLVTPGVITDATGFLLLVPFVRTLLAKALGRWAKGRVQLHVSGGLGPGGFGPGSLGGGPLEGGPLEGGPGPLEGGPFGSGPFGPGSVGAGPFGPRPFEHVPPGGDVIDVEPRDSRPVSPPSLPPADDA
ncbi:MAG: FxsA family protein [Planctomycetota bacterium]